MGLLDDIGKGRVALEGILQTLNGCLQALQGILVTLKPMVGSAADSATALKQSAAELQTLVDSLSGRVGGITVSPGEPTTHK